MTQNQGLICANLLSIISKRDMIHFLDKGAPSAGAGFGKIADQIEHCSAVDIQVQKNIQIAISEIVLPYSQVNGLDCQVWASNILEDPYKFLYKEPKVPRPAQTMTDLDKVILKFTTFQQKAKFVPKNMQDLERIVKKSVRLSSIPVPVGVTSETFIENLTQQAIKRMTAEKIILPFEQNNNY